MFGCIRYSRNNPNGFIQAYDCLPHDLLIAKFKAYGFDFNSLCLFNKQSQRVKIGSLKSTAERIENWHPTGISPRSLAF